MFLAAIRLKCYRSASLRTRYPYRRMRFLSLLLALSGLPISLIPASAAALPSCTEGARTFYPCEFSFDFDGANTAYRDEILTVEFRSPSATTYRLRAFWAAKNALKVRFSPTETGILDLSRVEHASAIRRQGEHLQRGGEQ